MHAAALEHLVDPLKPAGNHRYRCWLCVARRLAIASDTVLVIKRHVDGDNVDSGAMPLVKVEVNDDG